MMKSLKIGDLLARTPIVQGGMGVGISLSGLASAVANEGGVGVISSAGLGVIYRDYSPDYNIASIWGLREELRKAREKTRGIIGVNVMVAMSNFADMVKTAIAEKADIIFSGAGLPLNLPSFLTEDAKTKLAPIVSSARAAKVLCQKWFSEYKYIPDAIVVEGPKAGGHLGYKADQISDEHYSLEAIVPQIVAEVRAFEAEHNCRVAIASYSGTLASKFNRRVQRILESQEYAAFFPDTSIKRGAKPPGYIRTADEVEIIGRRGGLLSVGREGSLTGNRVDCFVLDDLYKDALEANSPLVRANCWEWYTSVVRTRMHNASRELVVFTRWHEEDLIGTLAAREPVEELRAWSQLDTLPADRWLHLNFEALKTAPPTEVDPRQPGEALWERQHGAALLEAKRRLDPLQFEAMYQGRPSAREGLLYGLNFAEYDCLPHEIVRRANYTDTADTGDDYLCSLSYAVDADGVIYITDAVYSREPMEATEPLVGEMLVRSDTRQAAIESNNGGRGFARAVQALAPGVRVEWFHQSGNKEARILSNSATALHLVRFPRGWNLRWPELYAHLTTYRRKFRANRWHDAADVVTGIVEREAAGRGQKRVRGIRFL